MNNKDRIAVQQLVIANAQAVIKELESQQGKRWKPELEKTYWLINSLGEVVDRIWNNFQLDSENFNNFNCYETEELAAKASPMMHRNNAIIMACLMVDPDFVPDYLSGNQRHYSFEYKNSEMGCEERWNFFQSFIVNSGPCVSTQEKWEEAAALLKEWGIE
jgi:hypothetical protein